MTTRISSFVIFLAVLAAGLPVSAQQTKKDVVRIVHDPAADTYVAEVTDDAGTSRYPIINDPTNDKVIQDPDLTFPKEWTNDHFLGRDPWGPPASSFDQIRHDPKFREYLRSQTKLPDADVNAIIEALDDQELPWVTLKASQVKIEREWWGLNWHRERVEFKFEPQFLNTEVYAFFVHKGGFSQWYNVFAYCRNLGQPFQGFTYEVNHEQRITEVKPTVVPPACRVYTLPNQQPVDRTTFPLGTPLQFVAQFNNPNGVTSFSWRHVLINQKTGERRVLSLGAEVFIPSDVPAGDYILKVEGMYNGEPIDADGCQLRLSFTQPPEITHVTPPPPETPKGITTEHHGGCHKGCVIGIAAAVIGAGVVGGVLLTQHGNGEYKSPQPVQGSHPAAVTGVSVNLTSVITHVAPHVGRLFHVSFGR